MFGLKSKPKRKELRAELSPEVAERIEMLMRQRGNDLDELLIKSFALINLCTQEISEGAEIIIRKDGKEKKINP